MELANPDREIGVALMLLLLWLKEIVCEVAPVIRKVCVTESASYQEPLPAWEAVNTQVPPDTKVIVADVVFPLNVPDPTVQTPVDSEVKTSNKEEVVLALILREFVDLLASDGLLNVIACACPIVKVT